MLYAMHQFLRRIKARLKQRFLAASAPAGASDTLAYPAWLVRRLIDRKLDYPAVQEQNLFSILTPVFDPPLRFLQELGESLFAQDHADWQWVLVENGCRDREVVLLLECFARDPRVTLVHTPEPRGIMGGMRLALEHARGRYVCPVDHDDRLYPDALRVVAAALQAAGWPKLAYTDEDKLLPDGNHHYPFLKPSWDPLLFLNCCYVAHLGVMDRVTALELGVYSDAGAEGTPDGDAFCRYVAAGHVPLHIPEVVYSWRMHPASTALRGIAAKPYVLAGQKHALTRYLQQTDLASSISLRTNPLPRVPGIWRVAPAEQASTTVEKIPILVKPGGAPESRRHVFERLSLCRGIHEVVALPSHPDALLQALNRLPDARWVALLDPNYVPLTTDFVEEWSCVRQAVPDAVVVGGIILNRLSEIETAGLVWGFEGILGSPLRGCSAEDLYSGAGALTLQRCVTAADTRFFLARVDFLRRVVQDQRLDADDPLLPAWLGAYAQEERKRILFTPYLRCCQIGEAMPRLPSHLEEFRFLTLFGHLLTRERYYPAFYGLRHHHAYQVCQPQDRAQALNPWMGNLLGSDPSLFNRLLSTERFEAPLVRIRQEFTSSEKRQTELQRQAA
jgi:hypothetical protein